MNRPRMKFGVTLLSLLVATAAPAQTQLPTLSPNTVLGRLGVTPGPAQAIPFSQLGPTLITSNLAVTAPLSISGLTLAITGAAGQILAGTPPAFTLTPTLGVPSTSTGSLAFATSAGSGKVTVQAPTTSTNWTFKFPTTAGSNGQSLQTDGSGNTTWAAGAGTVNSGTAGQLAYYATTAAAISGNANLNISTGALTLGQAGSVVGSVCFGNATSGTVCIQPTTGALSTAVATLAAGTYNVVGDTLTQTLTNKTLTSPAINTATIIGGTHTAITGLGVRDTSAAFDLTLAATSTSAALTAGRTLTLDVGNVAHTIQYGTTANTITFPSVASDTVAMLAAAQTITSKTFTSSTYNGNTFTTGTGTLTIAAGKTLTASNTLTFAGTDATTITFQGTDTYVGRTTTDTLTNKTLTAPVINAGTIAALTNLGFRSTGSGAFDVVFANTENLTAQRTLTLTLNNAARTVNLSGNLTLAGALSTAGGSAITLTTTGTTTVTLPTTGTLAAIDTSQTFSGSNIFSALTQFSDIKLSSGKIYPTADGTTALQVTKADGLTRIVNFDTTNARVGINKSAGAFDLDVNGSVNVGATLSFVTLDATSLGTSTSTITGLTVNNSPSSSNDYLLYYNASDGRIRKATVGSIAAGATAGVASLNGLTGGLSIVASGTNTVSASGGSVTINNWGEASSITNCTVAASVAANALTVALKGKDGNDPSASNPCYVSFRSTTAATGDYTVVAVTAATSFATGTSGSTFGSSNNVPFKLWVEVWNNAGTVAIGVSMHTTAAATFPLNEGSVASSTACSACTNAATAGTFYTTSALTSKAFRVVAYLEWGSALTTAGTYASGPTLSRLVTHSTPLPGMTIQSSSGSVTAQVTTTSTTYVTTGLSATLSPTSATNPVVCTYSGGANPFTTSGQITLAIQRGGSVVGFSKTNANFSGTNGGTSVGISDFARDFPGTTGSTTWTVFMKSDNASHTVAFPYGTSGSADGGSQISCIEIAA